MLVNCRGQHIAPDPDLLLSSHPRHPLCSCRRQLCCPPGLVHHVLVLAHLVVAFVHHDFALVQHVVVVVLVYCAVIQMPCIIILMSI